MGTAIVLETLDFSANNLGSVEFEENVALEAISISGQSTIGGSVLSAKYTINYVPVNTNQKRVTWSIVEGSELGTIDENGVLTLNGGGVSDGIIIIKAASVYNETIYATKEINVVEVLDFKKTLVWHEHAYWYNGYQYGNAALIIGAENSINFCTFDFVPSTEGNYKIEIASGYYVRPMGASQPHPESYTDVKRNDTTYTNGADLTSEKILSMLSVTHWALNIGKGANFSSAISLDEAKSAITFTKI